MTPHLSAYRYSRLLTALTVQVLVSRFILIDILWCVSKGTWFILFCAFEKIILIFLRFHNIQFFYTSHLTKLASRRTSSPQNSLVHTKYHRTIMSTDEVSGWKMQLSEWHQRFTRNPFNDVHVHSTRRTRTHTYRTVRNSSSEAFDVSQNKPFPFLTFLNAMVVFFFKLYGQSYS